ncbi:hypothetical protein GCM10010910_16870 [Microbacterium nanhaiense]|uniref:Uncharacterized protein n=1 Tax=Microbacterium nanhaiense TaxID=1301026 RepID=A0ABQ2N0E0_9MICO|nr:hypothetical protein [Microbacterium nanhaiense]GGO63700.1 hypothetical protein GCM10010910_16870 [Microbacterium nanhaiense]
MVSSDARARSNRRLGRDYVAGSEGAPPLPPEGGYRHERRFPDRPFIGDLVAPGPRPRGPRAHPLGWIALCGAALFALLLGLSLLSGEGQLVLSPGVLFGQAVVVGMIIAAFCVPRGRVLAGVALTIALVCNAGTAAALGAMFPTTAGDVSGTLSEEDRARLAYPGVRGIDSGAVLNAPSLEQVIASTDALSQEIRDRLSDELGYTWVQITDASTRRERNGYGGESLLQQYFSPTWRTEQPLHDYDEKLRAMSIIDEVLARDGAYYALYPLNVPDGSVDESVLESLYGSADPREQSLWEYGSSRMDASFAGPEPTLFYATITDLANDASGDARAREEASRVGDDPLEGLDLTFISRQLLSEADREAFEAGS